MYEVEFNWSNHSGRKPWIYNVAIKGEIFNTIVYCIPPVVEKWFNDYNIDCQYCYTFSYYVKIDSTKLPYIDGIVFIFENKNDALLFKTSWSVDLRG